MQPGLELIETEIVACCAEIDALYALTLNERPADYLGRKTRLWGRVTALRDEQERMLPRKSKETYDHH